MRIALLSTGNHHRPTAISDPSPTSLSLFFAVYKQNSIKNPFPPIRHQQETHPFFCLILLQHFFLGQISNSVLPTFLHLLLPHSHISTSDGTCLTFQTRRHQNLEDLNLGPLVSVRCDERICIKK